MAKIPYPVVVLVGGLMTITAVAVFSHLPSSTSESQHPMATEQAAGTAGSDVLNQPVATVDSSAGIQTQPGVLQKDVKANEVNRNLEIAAVGDVPAFDTDRLTVHPGDVIGLTFRNQSSVDSGHEHTWVLVRPRSESRVARAAMQAGASNGWIANSPDVLAHTSVVQPGGSETIFFRAPKEPGDYPFICTYPGHFNSMKGILEVRPSS